jgi:hypothetical protein
MIHFRLYKNVIVSCIRLKIVNNLPLLSCKTSLLNKVELVNIESCKYSFSL